MEAVCQRLIDQRVIRDFAPARKVSAQASDRETPRPEILGVAALKLGGVFLPLRLRLTARAVVATQRKRVGNIGASSRAWVNTSLTLVGCR
ncbi:MAG: hypothetical protein CM1200mP20_11460 [Pseudomonadota bacterium]|nr:MAG: hypothetical protein CM1200mP20_11460 [Pseudomonadota bacterium]